MKKLMIIIGIATEVCAFAALASECKGKLDAKPEKGTSVQCVAESGKITREQWNAMSPDERWTLDFRDVLSWRDLIWAKDAKGRPLAIHN